MKISIEFSDLKDMLFQLPKFAQLIVGSGSSEARIAAALEDETPVIKITSTDGKPLTKEEKEKIREAIAETAGWSVTPEEKPAPAASAAPEAPAAPAPTAEVSETKARAALNGLVKARSNAAVKLVFKKLGVTNFGDLKEESQYAEAMALADWVSSLTDDEYAAALKDAGIQGGRK